MKQRVAVVAGATGLVGSSLLSGLLESHGYLRVHVFTRRSPEIRHPKLSVHLIDFDHAADTLPDIPVDDVFCTLGTTIKKAGSQPAFRRVDHEYVVSLGKWAETQGAGRFLVVSSMGADAGSKVFYSRVKGEMEEEVSRLNIGQIMFFRPSLLMGKRSEKRFGEMIAQAVMGATGFLFAGPLSDFRGIPAGRVAKAMIRAAGTDKKGVTIYRSGEIQKMGGTRHE